MKYNVKAKVNYPDEKGIDIPDYNGLTQEGAYELVRRLLKTEADATSFEVNITVNTGK